MTFAARSAVGSRLETCNEQEVDDFDHVAYRDTNCATRLSNCKTFGMVDG